MKWQLKPVLKIHHWCELYVTYKEYYLTNFVRKYFVRFCNTNAVMLKKNWYSLKCRRNKKTGGNVFEEINK